MVRSILVLLACQLAGTVVSRVAGVALPGPVLGLLLLLGLLVWRDGPSASLRETSHGILKYFGLLFVPAGVGVVNELGVLRDNALAIGTAIVVSTLLGLAVTGVLMQVLIRRGGRHA